MMHTMQCIGPVLCVPQINHNVKYNLYHNMIKNYIYFKMKPQDLMSIS